MLRIVCAVLRLKLGEWDLTALLMMAVKIACFVKINFETLLSKILLGGFRFFLTSLAFTI